MPTYTHVGNAVPRLNSLFTRMFSFYVCLRAVFVYLADNLSLLLLSEENSGNEDFGESLYPSLLHFCASYGLASACEWLLHNTEDKRSWKNRDGQTPVELAEHTNYVHLKEVLLKAVYFLLFVFYFLFGVVIIIIAIVVALLSLFFLCVFSLVSVVDV